MKAVTAEIMAEIDRAAQEEYGIPQAVLMENAGRAVAEAVIARHPRLEGLEIAVLCGKGNNGGDGFAAARCLAEKTTARLSVFCIDAENVRQGAARDNFKTMSALGIETKPLTEFIRNTFPGTPAIVIDAIFGTGFRGELPDVCGAAAEKVKEAAMALYAVDIPSGLDATTGEASEPCFSAALTVTFGLPKQGFYLQDGPSVCGEVAVANIGFPEELLARYAR